MDFACKPKDRQAEILKGLKSVGLMGGIHQNRNGVRVFSTTLALDFLRFKVCGVGHESWVFDETPLHKGEWVAGLLDADGSVRPDGNILFYQKPHGGLGLLCGILDEWGVLYTRKPQRGRNLEVVRVRKQSVPFFARRVRPRFLPKYTRLAQIAANNGHSLKLKGAEFTKDVPVGTSDRNEPESHG